jgi:hypothetical protein
MDRGNKVDNVVDYESKAQLSRVEGWAFVHGLEHNPQYLVAVSHR